MAVFLKGNRRAFVHIPRTGGTFVEHVLVQFCGSLVANARGQVGSKHALTPLVYQKSRVKTVFMPFTVIRHPVDWYVSVWNYLLRRKTRFISKLVWHPFKEFKVLWDPDFDRWISVLYDCDCTYSGLLESYIGPENSEWCDVIGRTETLNIDLERWLERIGINVNLKQEAPINVRTSEPPFALSKQTRSKIEQVEIKAMKKWSSVPIITPQSASFGELL